MGVEISGFSRENSTALVRKTADKGQMDSWPSELFLTDIYWCSV